MSTMYKVRSGCHEGLKFCEHNFHLLHLSNRISFITYMSQHSFGQSCLKTALCTGFNFSVRCIGSKKEIILV